MGSKKRTAGSFCCVFVSGVQFDLGLWDALDPVALEAALDGFTKAEWTRQGTVVMPPGMRETRCVVLLCMDGDLSARRKLWLEMRSNRCNWRECNRNKIA
jgi:hypothetical protein